jgi:hypothetical protein
LTVAGVYALAAELLPQRVWAYVAICLLRIAYGLLLDQLHISPELLGLAWTGVAAVLLGCAEVQVRWTAENRRPLIDTIFGRGQWRSKFASPLFSAGCVASVVASWLAWVRYWNATPQSGIRQLDTPTILAFLMLVVLASLSSVARRTSFFPFAASWLFLIPFNALAGRVYAHLGLTMTEAELARLLAVLGAGYVFAAHATDRFGGHYAFAARCRLRSGFSAPGAGVRGKWAPRTRDSHRVPLAVVPGRLCAVCHRRPGSDSGSGATSGRADYFRWPVRRVVSRRSTQHVVGTR